MIKLAPISAREANLRAELYESIGHAVFGIVLVVVTVSMLRHGMLWEGIFAGIATAYFILTRAASLLALAMGPTKNR